MLTDESKMPFGKYAGQKLANVPASYLLWLYNENKCYGELKSYIKENLQVLQTEIKRDAK